MGKEGKNGRFQRKVRMSDGKYSEVIAYDLNNFLATLDIEHIVDVKFTESREGFTAMVVYDDFVPVDEETNDRERWIPVSERLPGESANYLASVDSHTRSSVKIVQYNTRFGFGGIETYEKVKAWRCLPEPYEV